ITQWPRCAFSETRRPFWSRSLKFGATGCSVSSRPRYAAALSVVELLPLLPPPQPAAAAATTRQRRARLRRGRISPAPAQQEPRAERGRGEQDHAGGEHDAVVVPRRALLRGGLRRDRDPAAPRERAHRARGRSGQRVAVGRAGRRELRQLLLVVG